MVCWETTRGSFPSSSSSVDLTMVVEEEEMEAAEALADLAHLAMRDWGQKGKRAKKRVKSESPPSVSALALHQDEGVVGPAQCERVCINVVAEPVKTELDMNTKIEKSEQDEELTNSTPIGTTSYPSFNCTKSRRNLTKEEKEERRIRRILANRESARQTIRRRQALCENLTKKAAEITLENESLKRKKELAFKQYQLLEETNRFLKVQMSKARKAEVEESPKEYVQIPSSLPTNSPFLLVNRPPFAPVFWPSVIQSSHSIQLKQVRQSQLAIPSNMFACNGVADSSHELGNPICINGSSTPLYVIPCPWFFPQLNNGNGLQLQPSCLEMKQEGALFDNQASANLLPRTDDGSDNKQSVFPIGLDAESSVSVGARPITDLNENPAQSPPVGDDQQIGGPDPLENRPIEIFLSPLLDRVGVASTVKNEDGLELELKANTENSTSAFRTFPTLPENDSESIICASKKITDAIAAAEARRRRKQLTKMKNLHGRQSRMQC